MTIERTTHLAVAIGLYERMDDKMLSGCFQNRSATEVRAYLKQLRLDGYEYVPNCDDCDEKGLCRGHKQ